MPLTKANFCGLTVRDFQTQIGWNTQPSTLKVQLVQDIRFGDYPNPPSVGTPIVFEYHGFHFGGLLQRWTKQNSTDGLPTFEAICIDPREILDGATIITGNYSGATFATHNLINAYGYMENLSYGFSGSTNAGMPWDKILLAIEQICNVPLNGAFGGPLVYRGFAFSLDLSELPRPPKFYRMPLSSIGLMEAISQVCEDSGCDFFVELVGFTIKIRTVSRFFQPPLGTITAIANTNTGNIVRSESGIEARNEITSAFLVGGEKTGLHIGTEINSFWGYDVNGDVILGQKKKHPDEKGLHDFFYLNSTGVADLIGSTSYYCNEIELRCALSTGGYKAWAAYIGKYKPELTFVTTFYNGGEILDLNANNAFRKKNPKLKIDVLNARKDNVMKLTDNKNYLKAARLYEFVLGYARDFYGIQFLVKVPFVLAKQDDETFQISYSQEPTDAGFFEEGAQALGLSVLNEDVFKEADERFVSFAYFPSTTKTDTSRVDWNSTVIEQYGQMYTRTTVDKRMLFPTVAISSPAVHVSLSSPLYEEPEKPYLIGPIFNKAIVDNQQAADNINKRGLGGTIGVDIFPKAVYPSAIIVPLKSNVQCYGPWYINGAPGKVRFEFDSGLTPWEYGGISAMNNAANARVLTTVTNMQLSESGTIEKEGVPEFSLGDTMQMGGPNLTNITVNIGTNGVTTSYRFETFTPKFGQFSKANAERLKRMSLGQVELRRSLRKALNREASSNQTRLAALQGYLNNAPNYVKRQTPYDVIMGTVVEDDDPLNSFGNYKSTRYSMTIGTFEESVSMCNPTGEEYQNSVIMGLGGIFAPYTLDVDRKPFTTGAEQTGNTNLLPTWPKQDQYSSKQSDVYPPFFWNTGPEIVTSESVYPTGGIIRDFAFGPEGPSDRKQNAVGIKYPLVLVGPNYSNYPFKDYLDSQANPSGIYSSPLDDGDYQSTNNISSWKAGPVELSWDERRGLWSSRDLIYGTITGSFLNSPLGMIPVFNYLGTTTSEDTGKKAIAGRMLPNHEWFIIAMEC